MLLKRANARRRRHKRAVTVEETKARRREGGKARRRAGCHQANSPDLSPHRQGPGDRGRASREGNSSSHPLLEHIPSRHGRLSPFLVSLRGSIAAVRDTTILRDGGRGRRNNAIHSILPEPCQNRAGTLPEPCRNPARTVPEPCRAVEPKASQLAAPRSGLGPRHAAAEGKHLRSRGRIDCAIGGRSMRGGAAGSVRKSKKKKKT